MLSVPFYHSLIKKYVVIFGTLFNNIRIDRIDDNGVVARNIRVPIAYGPREKFLARVEANPSGIADTAIILPRIAFELTGISYAPDRKLQTTIKQATANNINGNSVVKKVYQPVPYDLQFTLSILARSTEDATKIVEQILPYFTPEWTVSARLLEDFATSTDIPIILSSISLQDEYESDFKTRRMLTYTLVFTLKGYFYGPVTQSKVIKFASVNTYAPDGINAEFSSATTPLTLTTTQPGLDANGNPTTDVNTTISYLQIDETDNFDYIVINTDNPSG